MNKIKILDKSFSIFLHEKKINSKISKLAEELNTHEKSKDVVFLGILNGCFMFVSELMKNIDFDCRISFVKLASYQGTSSTGNIKELLGINDDIKDKTVIILEDIVDTGYTIDHIKKELKKHNPAEIKTCTMLFKPEAYQSKEPIEYKGIEIPNEFIVGYGLDYNGYGRNLRNIYQVTN